MEDGYEGGYVVVIGSAGLDLKGRPQAALRWGETNTGTIRNTVGGVARNIAENLARLEIKTMLITAVGDDTAGQRVTAKSVASGVDCDCVLRVDGAATGTYFALLDENGALKVAIEDYDVMRHLTADVIHQHEDLLSAADMLVIDMTLPDDALEAVFEIADAQQIRVAADPTTPELAAKLCPYLDQLYMVAPNASETVSLCGLPHPAADRDSATQVARSLVAMGAEIAVVTMGSLGLAYADGGGSGFIRAMNTEVVDTTGAGDAFSGAAIFGLLNGVPVDEAMRLGITAASLTLASTDTVLPDLSQELLYSGLDD